MINTIDIQRIEDFIKTLNQKELIYLNRIIVERIKLFSQETSTREMSKFNLGEIVEFTGHDGNLKKAQIVKMHKKTVSLRTIDGENWKVSPALLRHIT